MRANSQSKLLRGTWGLPLVGLAGTVAAILTAFARIGMEPQWETALVSAGAGLLVVGVALLLLKVAARTGR
jgi:biopolymer transport protein ExbB/TolQ